MRPQLFQGTYLLLLVLAIMGLARMLALHAGSDLTLLAWLGLIGMAVWGLVANRRDLLAAAGLAIGLGLTLYQRLTGVVAVGATDLLREWAALRRIDWSVIGYALLLGFTVWHWWRRERAARI